MLIRIRGGDAGIKEYLEEGRKDGRDYDRAELDERVILAGDLELTDQIINAMNKEGERYLHVTLAFKEDDISRDTLAAITEEFRAFAFAAFGEDEYSFYAEAHLPKIKSYTDRQTGELVERKPHIHIVIPERNLLAERNLNPFGRVDQQTKFLEAIQEHINNKYGLASPKDNRRVEFTDESTIIGRYKGDYFAGASRELKESILAEVVERRITDYGEFRAVVAEHGATRTRNASKPDAYLNVTPEGAGKGVNLKDYVFSPAFIELPHSEKIARLARDMGQGYEEAKAPRPSPADIAARLKEWREVRAAEIKYINSGNRKAYAAYREATPEQRRAILAERAATFYQKHRGPEPIERAEALDGVKVQEAPGKVAARPKVAAVGKMPPPAARDRLRTLSDLPTLQMELARPLVQPAPVLKYDGREVDNVPGQYAAEHREGINRGAGNRAEFDTIKNQLDAAQLLERLAQTHGVMPGKYEVTKGQDGGDRIKVGKRNLNVSDFLTSELHLPWGQAAPILRSAFAAQLVQEQQPKHSTAEALAPRPPRPDRKLWADYRRDWPPLQRRAEAAAERAQRDSERQRRAEGRQAYQAARKAARDNRTLTPVARKAALSVLAMTKVQDDMQLRATIKVEREALKAERRMTPAEQFRAYLTDRASKGDAEALGELRRQRIEQPSAPAGERIEGQETRPEAPPLMGTRYQVDRSGNVTYYDDQRRAMFVDHGARVRFEIQDREALETGLRLAVQKFGPNLALKGSAEYRGAMAEIAADSGLRVTFQAAEDQQRYEARREAIRLGREYIDQAGAPAGTVETPPAQTQQQEPPTRAPEALGGAKVPTEPRPAPAALDRTRDKAPDAPAPAAGPTKPRKGHSR